MTFDQLPWHGTCRLWVSSGHGSSPDKRIYRYVQMC